MSEPSWRKSSYSADNGCWELADLGHDTIGVRDSKDPEGGELHLTRDQLRGLVDAIKAGEYDDLT